VDGPVRSIAGELLRIHRGEDGSITLVEGHTKIGSIQGDASSDLNEFLAGQPKAANLLKIKSIKQNNAYMEFEIDPEQ
jgi:hypothetical protein